MKLKNQRHVEGEHHKIHTHVHTHFVLKFSKVKFNKVGIAN